MPPDSLTDHFDESQSLTATSFRRRPTIGVVFHKAATRTDCLPAAGKVLERLFPRVPGVDGRRSPVWRYDRQVEWFFEAALCAKFPERPDGLLLSRPLIEFAVRNACSPPNLKVLKCRRNRPPSRPSAGGKQRTGVRLDDKLLSADLVVDAQRRGSNARPIGWT